MAKTQEPGVGLTISVRLDPETRKGVAAYMAANNMTASQAARVLFALALAREDANPDTTFRNAAFREGLLKGASIVKRGLDAMIDSSLREFEGI